MAYGLDIPARKRPHPRDGVTARRILLAGLAGMPASSALRELAPLHPGNSTFPGEVFVGLGAGALGWCAASGADPVALAGMREWFLPGCSFAWP
jgi:hypothetical protein